MSRDGLTLHTALFNAMPGKHLVLCPDEPLFTIAAVSDEYLGFLLQTGRFTR